MNTPQDRVIKKMIDNIVETNRPSFEKPVTGATASATVTSGTQMAAPTMVPEDYALITRKLDYGFNNLRQENAEMRKQLEELGGGIKLLRGDLENIRSMLGRGSGASHSAPAPQRHEEEHTPQPASHGHGAPQYRESAADAAYHQENGGSSHHEEPQQARGTQKKDDTTIDISKVFYYGKK